MQNSRGPGVDVLTKEKLFEQFFQAETAQKSQGFGLGLAICKLIVESHGGKIGVDSPPQDPDHPEVLADLGSLGAPPSSRQERCGARFWFELAAVLKERSFSQ